MRSLAFKTTEGITSCVARLSALLLAVVVISTTASTAAPPIRAAVSASPLPVRAWWTMATTARKDLERAAEFGVNTLIVQNDVEYMFAWNAIMDRLCMYDFSPAWRRQGAERTNVDQVRANYRGITADARRRGIDCYVMCAEIFLPKGFQPLSYDNPEVWTLISNRLCEVFRALPDLGGYMLYLTEGDGPEVEFLSGSETSKAKRAQRLIETVWGACRAEHRKLIVATFIHTPAMLDAVAEALRSLPPHPDFAVMQYCCPNDWGLYALLNPAIGKVGPHPEILGFDCAAENWGQGAHPFVQAEFMAQRLTEARQRSTNIVGISCWVSWYGRQALGTFNEASIYAGYALERQPTRPGRDILREWCARRFGAAAAGVAANCLARTLPAVMKAQHIRGYWQDTWLKSCLPTLKELDEILIDDSFGEALTKWDPDPELRRTWEGIQSPNEAFLRQLLAEKDEAIRLCQQSLDEVRANEALFKAEDRAALRKAFEFQAEWSRVWRDRTHAFFLRRIGQKQGWPADTKNRLDEVLGKELANADELERRYGKDMYPVGPERERQFVGDLRKSVRPAPESIPANVADPTAPCLVTGRMRPAFDHLGNLSAQLDAAIASRCTVVYATGIGAYSYLGLPSRPVMDAYLASLKEYNRKAHEGGVGIVLSYLCATSIVGIDRFATNWDDYFPARPADFAPKKMLQQDIEGHNLPSWYGGEYAPADMWNPYWREYTKLTIKLAAESGHDGVYFDNPTVHTGGNYSPYAMKAWARFLRQQGMAPEKDDFATLRTFTKSHPELWRRFRVTEAADFIRELHDYCRSLRSGFLLTVNNSLNSWNSFYSQPQGYGYSIAEQSRNEDLITIEDLGSQPRRQGRDSYVSYGSTLRLVHAIDNGRPLSICTTDGDYIGPPDLMGLSIAECTAHDASYMVWSCWEPAFREAFAAGAARYHSFLATNVPLLVDSRPVSDFLLVWPYENWLRQPDCITAYLARELSAANLQYDVVTEADLSPQRLKAYPTVAYSTEEGLVRPKTMETLRAYEQQGGHVVAIGPGVDAVPAGVRAESKAAGYSAAVSRLKEILDPPSVVLDGPVGVRAVVRRAKTGELLLHLYNLNVTRQDSYHDRVEPVENLRIVWYLPAGEAGAGGLRLQTPDEQATSGSLTCAATHAKGRVRLEFVVPKLKIWTIARLQAAGG